MLPGSAGRGEGLLQREKVPYARPIGQRRFEDDHQAPRRHARVDEVVGQVWPPLIEPSAIEHVIAGGLRGIKEIAVGVVLVLLPPGVAPIIEDLAAKEMPTHAPGVTILVRVHDLLAHLDRIDVHNLEGGISHPVINTLRLGAQTGEPA